MSQTTLLPSPEPAPLSFWRATGRIVVASLTALVFLVVIGSFLGYIGPLASAGILIAVFVFFAVQNITRKDYVTAGLDIALIILFGALFAMRWYDVTKISIGASLGLT